MPVGESLLDETPFEMVGLGNHATRAFGSLVLETVGAPGALFDGEEAGGVWEVVHDEEGDDGDDDGEEALEDEDPSPSFVLGVC